jgi:integrase
VPVGNDLQPIAEEIIANVDATELVLPSLRSFNPGVNSDMRPVANPLSTEGLIALISGIAARAGVEHRVTPHHLRHYFGEIATATAGIHTTQHLLGHQSIQTTQIYAGQPSLDDLTNAMNTIDFRLSPQIVALSPPPDRIRVNTS